MVAEPCLLRMGNRVSSNLKHALLLETSSKTSKQQQEQTKERIGILSFEVANVMSKTIHLHKSLTDSEISKLKSEILDSEGVMTLVSSDEKYLLGLALAEKLDDLNQVAGVVSRLGKKCTVPALKGFEHVYGDLVGRAIDVRDLGFLVKDMEGMVRKMERHVSSTANLYSEMEVLNELERATKKFEQNQHEESRKAFEQKLVWQKQDVRHLKDVSLWNQTYDKVVELLARTVCTIYARISLVFGDNNASRAGSCSVFNPDEQVDCGQKCGGVNLRRDLSITNGQKINHTSDVQVDGGLKSGAVNLRQNPSKANGWRNSHSGLVDRAMVGKKETSISPQHELQKGGVGLPHQEDYNFVCGMGPGRLFIESLSLNTSGSKVDDDDEVGCNDRNSQISSSCSIANSYSGFSNRVQAGILFNGDQRQQKGSSTNGSKFGPKSGLTVHTPPNTVGGSALALHYANVVIVIEKLVCYPHLVGEEARDDLYEMLPTSLRSALKTRLKSYVKDMAIYDAPLAHDWKEKLRAILRWLAPLAHNMIRWQSERNFEQQQIVTRTNVLLLQTLYFADKAKTEAAICELLVGLNYMCRYEHQQNALLDCASSFDFDDCLEWQMQYDDSYIP